MWKHYEINKKIEIKSFVSAFWKSIDENYTFYGESHDFWEILYVDKGSVCVSAEERVFELSKNDFIVHKPMEFHKFHIEQGKSARIFVLSFVLEGEAAALLDNLCINLSEVQLKFFKNIITLIKENQLGEKIKAEKNYKSYLCSGTEMYNVSEVFLQQLSCATELFLLSCIQEITTPVTALKSTDAVLFNKSVNIMTEAVYDWITVSQIAEKCNVSISYLKLIFSKYTGLGVHKYFLNLKLMRAMDFLKEGRSVSEVSDELNFCSQTYFSTVFKRETGITPSEYRGRMIKNLRK